MIPRCHYIQFPPAQECRLIRWSLYPFQNPATRVNQKSDTEIFHSKTHNLQSICSPECFLGTPRVVPTHPPTAQDTECSPTQTKNAFIQDSPAYTYVFRKTSTDRPTKNYYSTKWSIKCEEEKRVLHDWFVLSREGQFIDWKRADVKIVRSAAIEGGPRPTLQARGPVSSGRRRRSYFAKRNKELIQPTFLVPLIY